MYAQTAHQNALDAQAQTESHNANNASQVTTCRPLKVVASRHAHTDTTQTHKTGHAK